MPITYYCYKWRREKQMKAMRVARTATTMEEGLNTTSMQDSSQLRSNIGNTDMTAIVTSHELSIPGHLQVSEGTDYRQEREIARGAQGTVCMVHAFKGS